MRRIGAVLAGVLAIGTALSPAAMSSASAAASTRVTAATLASSKLTYPTRGLGRGAWSGKGVGGTLNKTGLLPGTYYRPSLGLLAAPGTAGSLAARTGATVSINDYAVYRGVVAVQTALKEQGYTSSQGLPILVDGIWGPKLDVAVRKFQAAKGLAVDGLFGPATSRQLFAPSVYAAAAAADPEHAEALGRLMFGTINSESTWDPGAVGALTPDDLGLGQINGPAHPSMSVDDRLDPKKALPYSAMLVDSNLKAFGYRLDEAAAAYNLGQGGARSWAKAGKPQYWPLGTTNDVHRYINKILNPVV